MFDIMKGCFMCKKRSLPDGDSSRHNQSDLLATLAKPIIVSRAKHNANSVFSPLSLHIALGMIAAGSEGSTQERILSFLKFKSMDELHSRCSMFVTSMLADGSLSGGPLVSSANGVWVDVSTKFDLSYRNVLALFYKAHSNEVDFRNKPDEVINGVNEWAEKETNGLIKAILLPGAVDSLTMLLANALYFKGDWEDKFDALRTKEHKFHLLNGKTMKVAFVSTKKDQYISAYSDFKVLRLPFKHGEDMNRSFSMSLYLPNAKNGLLSLVKKISSEPAFVQRYLPREEVEVGRVLIPKFKISFGFETSKIQNDSGTAFPSGGGLNIFQKSYIGISEEGSEAESFIDVNVEETEAVVLTVDSSVTCSRKSKMKKRMNFVADHPFLFLITEDKSGAVLFMGSVVKLDPVASQPVAK